MMLLYVIIVTIMVKLNSLLKNKLHQQYMKDIEKERGGNSLPAWIPFYNKCNIFHYYILNLFDIMLKINLPNC